MKRIALATVALLGLAGSAIAADLPARPYTKAVVADPVRSWTGCYVGGGGGYSMSNIETREVAPVVTANQTNGGRGAFGTVQVGCDYQFAQSWLVGAFGDYNFGGARGDMSIGIAIGREKVNSQWAAGGRVGYLITPSFLTYFAGGYSQARLSDVQFVAGAVTQNVPGRTYSGYFIGSGYEYVLPWFSNLTWKTEYRFSQYSGKDTVIPAPIAGTFNFKPYTQEVRSELVWRFNWGTW